MELGKLSVVTPVPVKSEGPKGSPAGPCLMVIFGASGDLTKRKLVPALYNLSRSGYLPRNFAVIGFAFDAMNTEEFRESITREARELSEAPVEPDSWNAFVERLYYMQGDFGDSSAYARLRDLMSEVGNRHGCAENVLYYLATSPVFFAKIVEQLGHAQLVNEEEGQWRRVVIEKPFGHDLQSSIELNREITKVLREDQIYRIDHYLGKETVQNMLIFRFGNGIFEPIWNRRYIDHVQITVAETVGVERRGAYYEHAGALRDMAPNHLFQLVSMIGMEPPISFAASAVRDEKAKVIHALQPLHPDSCLNCAVRGQYGPGQIDGEPVPGYRSEPNVDPNSVTETFVALKLTIDNWRWAGVPFYLRTGKRMAKRISEITIQFRQPPFVLFRQTPVDHLKSNLLVVQIQPEEGISLRFGAKVPGPLVDIGAVKMSFNYADYFGRTPSTGYETLIYDCMIGDSTLFQRADMVEAGWSVVQPLIEAWSSQRPTDFPNYAAGTWGPEESEELLYRDGRHWRSTAW
jgi:glucose-6-phosphate 1-dehydrogenase